MVYLYLFTYTGVQHDFHIRTSFFVSFNSNTTAVTRAYERKGGGCSVGTLVRGPENQEGACESLKGHIASRMLYI